LPEKEVIDFIDGWLSSFTEGIGIIPQELPPVVAKGNIMCPIGRFFGFGKSKNSISNYTHLSKGRSNNC
jgi:hypothetical protein